MTALFLVLVVSAVSWYITILPSCVFAAKDIELVIGGIFPMTAPQGGWLGGPACLPATLMALDHVNNRTDILHNYKLRMEYNDSECEQGRGAKVMFDLLYTNPVKTILLAGCSLVTTTVAEAAPLWNLIVLSYGGSSPALSNRVRFPTLFRTHPSATINNPTRVALFRRFKWENVAILQSVEELFTSTAEDLEGLCRQSSCTIVSRQSFYGDPSDAVKNIKRQDVRVIVGLFYEKEARKVFCEVYKQKLYGRKYVWFLIGWYDDDWLTVRKPEEHIDCTVEEMLEAAQYHWTTEAMQLNQDGTKGIAKLTSEQFIESMRKKLSPKKVETLGGWVESPLAYDAIWALALALNCTQNNLAPMGIKLEDFRYNRSDILDEMYSCMNQTRFLGVSGWVMFSAKGDRIAWTQIEQMQDGVYQKVGYYDFRSDNLTLDKDLVKFAGGKAPPDQTKVVKELVTITSGVLYAFLFFAAITLLVAGACVVFNVGWAHRRIVQYSQRRWNNVVLFGISVCCAAVLVCGLDGAFVPADHFWILCQARAWLLTVGFSFAYGPMFAKIWLTQRMGSQGAKDKAVQEWKLFTVVSTCVGIDVVILIMWMLLSPMYRSIEILDEREPTSSDKDIKIRPLLEHCDCTNRTYWIVALFAYKGVLLLFGIFLAYDVRSIKVKHINDSRFIGLAIYNVALLCMITGPVSLIILSQPDASFAFISSTVLTCSWVSMGLIFLPKIMYVARVPGEIEAKALATESEVTPEDQERYKRLLAANEEIKRQIAEREIRLRELRQRLEDCISARKRSSCNYSGHSHENNLAKQLSYRDRDEDTNFVSAGETDLLGEDSGFKSPGHNNKALTRNNSEPWETDIIL